MPKENELAGRQPDFCFEGDGKTTYPVVAGFKTILLTTVVYFMVATPSAVIIGIVGN